MRLMSKRQARKTESKEAKKEREPKGMKRTTISSDDGKAECDRERETRLRALRIRFGCAPPRLIMQRWRVSRAAKQYRAVLP